MPGSERNAANVGFCCDDLAERRPSRGRSRRPGFARSPVPAATGRRRRRWGWCAGRFQVKGTTWPLPVRLPDGLQLLRLWATSSRWSSALRFRRRIFSATLGRRAPRPARRSRRSPGRARLRCRARPLLDLLGFLLGRLRMSAAIFSASAVALAIISRMRSSAAASCVVVLLQRRVGPARAASASAMSLRILSSRALSPVGDRAPGELAQDRQQQADEDRPAW